MGSKLSCSATKCDTFGGVFFWEKLRREPGSIWWWRTFVFPEHQLEHSEQLLYATDTGIVHFELGQTFSFLAFLKTLLSYFSKHFLMCCVVEKQKQRFVIMSRDDTDVLLRCGSVPGPRRLFILAPFSWVVPHRISH